jgi:hypothetical protein
MAAAIAYVVVYIYLFLYILFMFFCSMSIRFCWRPCLLREMQWVHDSFTRKELLLEEFYTSISPKNDDSGIASTVAKAVPCALTSWPPLLSHPLSASQSSFSQSTQTFLFMFFLMALLTMSCICFKEFRYYLLLNVVTYTACLCIGGIDNIELQLHGENGLFSSRRKGRDKVQ